ncbi:MAG: hypothetical protein AAGB00_04990 [Planctomycetota bacterium]
MTTPLIGIAVFVCVLTGLAPAEAAFIIEPNGKANDRFLAPVGINGTSTLAGAGTLAAFGLTPDAPSVFGGAEYRYTYTPGVDGDNTAFAAGDRRNSFATFIASGLPANFNGRYRVFRAHPQTDNVSGGPVTYEVQVNGATQLTQVVDQNLVDISTGLSTGANIGLWELIGEVTVADPSDTITVVQTATNPSFVSMRTAGVLFESIPEPASCLLIAGVFGPGLIARPRRAAPGVAAR